MARRAANAAKHQSFAASLRAAAGDLRAGGWRLGRRGLVPGNAEGQQTGAESRVYATSWARSRPLRIVRELAQTSTLIPLLRREVDLDIHGREDLESLHGPVLLVSNHASHLDTPVLLAGLPPKRRRTTAVAAVADYFFDAWWRAGTAAVVFNSLPIERPDGTMAGTPKELLTAGWSLIVYPEGTRSADGSVGGFRTGAARLAIEEQVPVLPVGIRGTYAAMPRGRRWPTPGRPRVSVRYGEPLLPTSGETETQLAARMEAAVRRLIAEDATSWWAVQRSSVEPSSQPAASWRRIWQESEQPVVGGRPTRTQIWRS